MAASPRPHRERLFCEVPKDYVLVSCDLIIQPGGEVSARANLNCNHARACLERYGSLLNLPDCHLNRLTIPST